MVIVVICSPYGLGAVESQLLVCWRKANAWEILAADLASWERPTNVALSTALSHCRGWPFRGREAITHLAKCVMRMQATLSSARRPLPASPTLNRRRRRAQQIGDFGSSRE